MIEVTQLGKSYGARSLFEGVMLKLVAGSRYGLVGANGSGKSTFLEIVAGDDAASEGSVAIAKGARVGVLRQDRFLNDEDVILELAMAGDELVFAAKAEQQLLVAAPVPDATRLAELEDRIAAHDGYTLEARASAILEGLGIPVPAHRRPLATLSGGFKLRVLLAQVLLGGPDVLLLDEPTNHLDILSIRWLEQFLAGYAGCAVVVSHDQRFLDSVATHILDVDYGTIASYPGNYSAFVVEKAAVHERAAAEIARAEAIVAEKRAWVERFGAKATKARQAQSRLKQIEKIEIGASPSPRADGLSSSSCLRARAAATSSRSRASPRRTAPSAFSRACRSPCVAASGSPSSDRTASASRRSSRSRRAIWPRTRAR
jgi:ATPase subunit of ABC transporter with duplicated ATPase domains